MNKLLAFAFSCPVLLAAATSYAQATPFTEVATEAAPSASVAAPPPVAAPVEPARPTDGVRFRGAIAAAGGAEFGGTGANSFAIGMGGLEGRVGVQISNLVGLYVAPYLAFGGGDIGGITAVTGTAGVSLLVDFTIADRFFIGVGGGYGVLNNPHGPVIHARLGGYPVMGVGEDGYSRNGLVLSLEARVFLPSFGGEVIPIGQMMGCIGYEVF